MMNLEIEPCKAPIIRDGQCVMPLQTGLISQTAAE